MLLLLLALLFLPLAYADEVERRSGLSDAQRDMISLVHNELLQQQDNTGIRLEEHFVTTEDGYILGMFRLRPSTVKGHKVALLMHGLLDSSIVWVNNGRSRSLAFILAELGYDVWLGNNRGNYWSRRHVSLNADTDAEFWDFSFDEMAQYDLPALVDFALKISAPASGKLTYVGHSQGSTQMMAALSTELGRTTLLAKLDHFIGLAPAIFEFHMTSRLMKSMAELGMDKLVELIGVRDFAPSNKLFTTLLPEACRLSATLICENMLDAVYGRSTHLNVERQEVFLAQFPAGTSARNVQHWAQHTRRPIFTKYDFGTKAKNLARYGQETAPAYDLSSFPAKLRTTLYFGEKDALQAEPDRALLEQALRVGASKQVEYIVVPGYSHVDFVWGRDAEEHVFPHIVGVMRSSSSTEGDKSNSFAPWVKKLLRGGGGGGNAVTAVF